MESNGKRWQENAAPGAHRDAAFIYAMHFSISIFMGLKKRDTNNELTIRLIRSHQQVVTKCENRQMREWRSTWHSLFGELTAILSLFLSRCVLVPLALAQPKQI